LKFRVKFFIVFIFLGSLLPNSDFHELSKISSLLQHFQELATKTNNQLGFIDFLKMHYACSDEKETEKHNNLPFKQMGNSAYDYFVSTPVFQCQQTLLVFTPEKHFIHSDLIISGQFTGSIWQPPQIV